MNLRHSVAVVFALTALCTSAAPEPHVEEIVAAVRAEVVRIKAADPEAKLLAFWDFDGTILKGDVSEGFSEAGVVRYAGLAELLIRAGYASAYAATDAGVGSFRREYDRLCAIGNEVSYPFVLKVFAGASAAELERFATARFADTYQRWFFVSSREMLAALENMGVENHIVSASPEVFVRGAAAQLGLPSTRFHGIRAELTEGKLTDRIEEPIPYGEGKTMIVRSIVAACPHGVAVAGFGNSYSTDGPFLRHIATQSELPGQAKGIAVMINGGASQAGFSEHFRLVTQRSTVDAKGIKVRFIGIQ